MKFIYPPIKNLSSSPNAQAITFDNVLKTDAFSCDYGSYIIGKNKTFHGGVNLRIPNGMAVQAVADGRIVAYRLSKDCQIIETSGDDYLEFSNNFILIEHDFNQFEYMRGIGNPYKNYKFYTLYMHLLPLNECSKMNRLPDWLVLDKKIEVPLLRGDRLSPKVLTFTQGFAKARIESENVNIRISESDVVTINGYTYLNKRLDYYDTQNKEIEILNKFFDTESVVLLNDKNAIPICSGELIGYAMQNEACEDDDDVSEYIHFEVWLDDLALLENKEINYNATYIEEGLDFIPEKNKLFSNLNCRSLGLIYFDNQVVLESLCIEEKSSAVICFRYEGSLVKKHTLDSGIFYDQVLKSTTQYMYTDADWLNRPVHPWVVYKQTDFFNNDGSIREQEYQQKYSNQRLWKKIQNYAVVKLEYSEWDNRCFESKFGFLKAVEGEGESEESDVVDFEILRQYQDSMSFFDKTENSELLPNVDEIYVVNPIEFLSQLKRCMLPGPPSANTHLLKRLIQYSLDEATYILNKLIHQMQLWIDGAVNEELAYCFKLWFGYESGVQASTLATDVNYHLKKGAPPEVESFDIARKIVKERLAYGLEILTGVVYNRLNFAWGMDVGAFVYPGDMNHNIHLGLSLFDNSGLDKEGEVNTKEIFKVPLLRRNEYGDVGMVNSLIHEVLHFFMGNLEVSDTSIIPYMYSYSENYKYLDDVNVDYVDIDGWPVSFSAYGLDACKMLALNIPSATLANADNYAEFVAEMVENKRPNIQYKRI